MKRLKNQRVVLPGVLLALTLLSWRMYPRHEHSPNMQAEKPTSVNHAIMNEGNQKLAFIENKGQFATEIRFLVRVGAFSFEARKNGFAYVWNSRPASNEQAKEEKPIQTSRMDVCFLGSNEDVKIVAEDSLQALRHYYNGGKEGPITHVRSFRKIRYENLYEQIDLLVYSDGKNLKYDFIVKPGADPQDIRLAYSGMNSLELMQDGSMNTHTSLGNLHEGKPYSYQLQGEDTVTVSNSYTIAKNVVQFELGSYNKDQTLIIDPLLEWATYYGGEANERALAVSTDQLGNVIITGQKFPYVFDMVLYDAFIAKYDPNGNLLWETVYGGSKEDQGMAICTDPSNNVIIAGMTHSNNGIAHLGYDDTYNENNYSNGTRFDRDAFLAKFSPNGTLMWGTYYGGEDQDPLIVGDPKAEEGRGVACDANGNIYLTGLTQSSQYIAMNGHDNTLGETTDAFLVKFSSAGTRLWATYFGGNEVDMANAVATDQWGNVYIAGSTESTGLAKNGHDLSYSEDGDAFVAKYNTNGTLLWATYYGDQGVDQGTSIDTYQGYVYLAGYTTSANFIAKNGHDNTYNGSYDAFLVQFNFLGQRMWATYYGGTDTEAPGTNPNVQVNALPNSDIVLGGTTKSNSGIATNSAYDATINGGTDAFLARFNQNGTRQWGTYYGGSGGEYLYGIASDPANHVYIAGSTYSLSKIAKNGEDNVLNSGDNDHTDAFLAKFDLYQSNPPGGPGGEGGGITGNALPNNTALAGSIDPSAGTLNLKVYPNPVSEQLHIYFSGAEEHYSLKVHNLDGKTLLRKEGLSGAINESIDVSQVAKGIYIVSVQTPTQKWVEKIVVK